jgi:hypothetical protein
MCMYVCIDVYVCMYVCIDVYVCIERVRRIDVIETYRHIDI